MTTSFHQTDRTRGGIAAASAAHSSPRLTYWRGFVADFTESMKRWELWCLLGVNDIRQRYRRSRLGQLWITMSMGAFVLTIGPIYAILFKTDIREFLPYLTVNMVVWGFLASMITEGCTVFIQNDGYIRQERIPKIVFLMRLLVRNLLILAHNALLIPIVFIGFGTPVSWVALLMIPGLAIVSINCLLLALILGTICTRFRDMTQIVANIVQMAFFLSPIFWQRKNILAEYMFVVDFNPFASYLSVVASPILGTVPSLGDYAFSLGSTVVLALIVVPFFARFRARIVYWL